MYKVIKSDNILEFLPQLEYVCKQENGVIVVCDEDKSQGIISKDNNNIYAFENTDLAQEYEVVTIEEIDDFEFWTQQQITDMELAMAEIYEIMLGGTN